MYFYTKVPSFYLKNPATCIIFFMFYENFNKFTLKHRQRQFFRTTNFDSLPIYTLYIPLSNLGPHIFQNQITQKYSAILKQIHAKTYPSTGGCV